MEKHSISKWSETLYAKSINRVYPRDFMYPYTYIILEGCKSGFNAANAMRTSLYYSTLPVVFLTMSSISDIRRFSIRNSQVLKPHHSLLTLWLSSYECILAHKPTLNYHISDMTLPIAFFKFNKLPLEYHLRQCNDSAITSAIYNNIYAKYRHNFGLFRLNKAQCYIGLECFARGAISIHTQYFPQNCIVKFLVGDENKGLSVANRYSDGVNLNNAVQYKIVYIPQYGTISSINVVNALAILLFYFNLDQQGIFRRVHTTIHYSNSHTLMEHHILNTFDEDGVWHQISDILNKVLHIYSNNKSSKQFGLYIHRFICLYNITFSTEICKQHTIDNIHIDTRLDPRPLHPVFFNKSNEDIHTIYNLIKKYYRTYSTIFKTQFDYTPYHRIQNDTEYLQSEDPCIYITLLYENLVDTRSLSGLIRLANAYCIDVVYTCKKRYQKQGAVGTFVFTDITHYESNDAYIKSKSMNKVPSDINLSNRKIKYNITLTILLVPVVSLPMNNTINSFDINNQTSCNTFNDSSIISAIANIYNHLFRDKLTITVNPHLLSLNSADNVLRSQLRFLLIYAAYQRFRELCHLDCIESRLFVELYNQTVFNIVLLAPPEGALPSNELISQANAYITLLSLSSAMVQRQHCGLSAPTLVGICLERLNNVVYH